MADWFFYDLPIWISLPTFVLGFLVLSWLILLGVRPWVTRTAKDDSEQWDRVLGYAMSSYGIFYGILLGLIAVSVYENFQRVNVEVLNEVSYLGTLYRDFGQFPDATGDQLQSLLRTYTLDVVNIDWPQMANGVIPTHGNTVVGELQAALYSYEPGTIGEQERYGTTLETWASFLDARRARLDETELVLPTLLWIVVAAGSVLNALMISLVEARSLRVHLVMAGIIAAFVALLIFTIASIDHPYSGVVSIDPEPYQDLFDQIMLP